jgi:hypothetical protein
MMNEEEEKPECNLSGKIKPMEESLIADGHVK